MVIQSKKDAPLQHFRVGVVNARTRQWWEVPLNTHWMIAMGNGSVPKIFCTNDSIVVIKNDGKVVNRSVILVFSVETRLLVFHEVFMGVEHVCLNELESPHTLILFTNDQAAAGKVINLKNLAEIRSVAVAGENKEFTFGRYQPPYITQCLLDPVTNIKTVVTYIYYDEKEVTLIERDRIVDMEKFIRYPSRIGWLDSVTDVYSTVYSYLVTGEMILKFYCNGSLDFLYTNVIMTAML